MMTIGFHPKTRVVHPRIGGKMMRKSRLDRDYALVQAYKCWHCDFYAGFGDTMAAHIEKEHPETLNQD